ncbi:hypothetical protein SNE40_015282 [Patella caerulea]|uniref:Uncharacterized protein n=1 Tax=Patella caerulea TaxID=87958 RepID=A0AAN8JJS5_PATCE
MPSGSKFGHMGSKCPDYICKDCGKVDMECECEIVDITDTSSCDDSMTSDVDDREGVKIRNTKLKQNRSNDRSKDSNTSVNRQANKKQKLNNKTETEEAKEINTSEEEDNSDEEIEYKNDSGNKEITISPSESTRNEGKTITETNVDIEDYSIIADIDPETPSTAVKTTLADDTRGDPTRRNRLITSPKLQTILDVVTNRMKKTDKDKAKDSVQNQGSNKNIMKEKENGGKGRPKKKS